MITSLFLLPWYLSIPSAIFPGGHVKLNESMYAAVGKQIFELALKVGKTIPFTLPLNCLNCQSYQRYSTYRSSENKDEEQPCNKIKLYDNCKIIGLVGSRYFPSGTS
jgi:hypothetical protein